MNYKKVIKFFSSKTLGIPTILIVSTLLALLYFSLGFGSWKFMTVGDDWASYDFAQNLAKKSLLINPFDMQGVYTENPVLGSMYQALFLKAFHYSHLAWRFSNIVLIIPLSLLFFLWVKKGFNNHIALLSTLLLQCSFYLANYFKIGYINPQALVLFLLCLVLAQYLSETLEKKYALLLGITLGLAFYIYIGPLFPVLLWPYLIPFIKDRRPLLKKLILTGIVIGVYACLILPGILDFTNINAVSTRTVLKKEYSDNWQILINIIHGFSLFYKNYDYFYNHFVSGPYLDTLSRTFAFLGTLICLKRIVKREYQILILTYVTAVCVITFTAPYAYLPTTRGIFYLPFGFVFAGIALYELFKITSRKLLVGITIISIFLLNLYQSQIGVFKETGYTQSALIIKALQDKKQTEHSSDFNAIFLQTDSSYRHDISQNISYFQNHYNVSDITFSHIPQNKLTCQMLPDTLLIIRRDESSSILSSLENSACQTKAAITIISPAIEL